MGKRQSSALKKSSKGGETAKRAIGGTTTGAKCPVIYVTFSVSLQWRRISEQLSDKSVSDWLTCTAATNCTAAGQRTFRATSRAYKAHWKSTTVFGVWKRIYRR